MQGDHYKASIAEWYDDWLSARRDDVDFYSSHFAGFPGTVLELACGTGRLLLPIAKQGVFIHGLDGSQDMLRILEAKASQQGLTGIQTYCQPMENFAIGMKFDAIFVASGSFQLLTTAADAMHSLTCIRNHLKDNGYFIVDVFVPWEEIIEREGNVYRVSRDTVRPNGERSIVLERFTTDLAKQLKLGTYRYEFYVDKRLVSCITDDLAIRWYWKDEFLKLLGNAGFTKQEVLTESAIYQEGYSFVFKASN